MKHKIGLPMILQMPRVSRNAIIVVLASLTLALNVEGSANAFESQKPKWRLSIQGPKSLRDRIAIVGAGPAGIHMAHLLKSKGFSDVEILEKEGHLGGKSLTVDYRGVAHEMGTVYLSPDYEENIIQLVKKYIPGDLIPLQQASVWLDKQRPVTYQEYLIRYAMAFYDSKNLTFAIGSVIRALQKYVEIHRDLFGDYEGEIMPEPNHQTMHAIRGTFADFLSRNGLEILAPFFYAGHTMQGYGHIDEIAALYGLMWNSPRFMNGYLGRLSGIPGETGFYLLKNGFRNLWKTMVEKDGIKIIYNVDIKKLWRHHNRQRWLEVCIDGRSKEYRKYDFVIWSPNMRSSLHTWQDRDAKEHEYFSKLSHWYFTTALMDSEGEERGPTPIDYWFDNMNHKREHSVWAQRDSYAAVNGFFGPKYQNGSLPSGNDGKATRTTVAYLMGRNVPPSEYVLKANLWKHFSEIGGKNLRILLMKVWHYFPRFTPGDIERGILWRILEIQGKQAMWYIGSSVSFESVKSVVEYNELLLSHMKSMDATQMGPDVLAEVQK